MSKGTDIISTNNPLVVDLDGTLIKTDLLFEAASGFITRYPHRILSLISWFSRGKATLKSQLANCYTFDPALLPYNEELIDWLREQKNTGREIILATASHRKLADEVAEHLNLFNEVLATEGNVNLKAGHKRDLLVNRYGEHGYDYIGDCRADLSVWKSAQRAYVVGSSTLLVDQARDECNVIKVFDDNKRSLFSSVIRSLRPHQWVKNVLLFIPLFTAHAYTDSVSNVNALLAFVIFCLTASSVYILNDIIDIDSDRDHARKKNRPFASGDLSLLHGWIAWPLLALASFSLAAFTLPPHFLIALSIYCLLTIAYSFHLKKKLLLDVLTLAGLYTLRIIAGAAAISVVLSFWLLSFSMFFFLSLAFIKRLSELKDARDSDKTGRLPGRGYVTADFEVIMSLGIGSGYLSVLVLALYIHDMHTAELYRSPTVLWLMCPLFLYWILRAWFIASRGDMHDDPVVFAIKDKISWIVGICFIGVVGVAKLF
jgi:4-hydroxybenzoate polyprenyltransferase